MSAKSHLVSVVLPAHNAERTVGEAVESVLRQEGVDLELIAVDDGSTDATAAVLSGVRDARLRVLSGPQGGAAAARNRAIACARGDMLAFIDADDVWSRGKLCAQLEALLRHPSAAVSYCWVNHIDGNGRYLRPDRRPRVEGDVYRNVLTHNFIDTLSAVMVRRQALEDVGGFNESLPLTEDWDLYVRLAARYAFVCVPQALVLYRQSPESLSSRVLMMESTYRRTVDQAFASAPESLRPLKAKNLALFYEYLTTKTSQGVPSRENGLLATRFFWKAVRFRAATVLGVWRRLWVLRGLGRALIWIAREPGAGGGSLEGTRDQRAKQVVSSCEAEGGTIDPGAVLDGRRTLRE